MMSTCRRVLLAAMCLAVLVSPGAVAQEGEEGGGEELEARHGLALFVGATHSTEDSDTAFTLGIDYEYRINRWVGIGGLVDHAFGDFRSWIYGVPVFLHAGESWKFQLAPAFEHEDGENNALLRLGVMYVFELERVGLAPALMVDFTDGDELIVFGVNLEWEF